MSSENLTVDYKLYNYKLFNDSRGILGVIDDRGLLFKIKRVFWIRDVPPGETRGHHYHKECEQLIVCALGSVTVWLDEVRYDLDENGPALYVPKNTVIELDGFSPDALILVLCSEYYNEDEVVSV